MNALTAEGVCRRYGEQEVLKDFSLALAEGEFVALMGPSGSGKSTFLHLAAGLLSADSGRILVGGADVTAMGDGAATKFRRRHVGVVFQSFNLLDERTVVENIVLPAKLDGAKPDPARVDELVKKLGLSGKERKRPSELSGGERQRVAIARALYSKPDIVLADEPTGNLDMKSAHEICAILEPRPGAHLQALPLRLRLKSRGAPDRSHWGRRHAPTLSVPNRPWKPLAHAVPCARLDGRVRERGRVWYN